VLWPWVFGFALGACVIVAAFAVGVGARKFVHAIGLFVLGALILAGSIIGGGRVSLSRHGVTVYEAPELEKPAR